MILTKLKNNFTRKILLYLVFLVLVVLINIIIHYLVWQACLETITEYRFVVVGSYSLKTVFLLPKIVLRIHIIFLFLLGVLLILKLIGVNRIKLLWVHKIKLIGVSRIKLIGVSIIKKLDNIEVTNVFKSLVFLNTIINMYLLYHIISIGYILFTLSEDNIEIFQSMFYNRGTLEVYWQPTTYEKKIYFQKHILNYAKIFLETNYIDAPEALEIIIQWSDMLLYDKVECARSLFELDELVLKSHEQVEAIIQHNVDNYYISREKYLNKGCWWWPFKPL